MELTEDIRVFLPHWLNAADARALWAQLKQFPRKMDYFATSHVDGELLQGDAWRGFAVFRPELARLQPCVGFVLSNSCDVSPENKRALPVRAAFAPLVSVEKYIALLSGLKPAAMVQAQLDALRRQEVTSVMYLPPPPGGEFGESLALLDDLHSEYVHAFLGSESRQRMFRLSQAGHYVLLLKLAIHFTRVQDGAVRG